MEGVLVIVSLMALGFFGCACCSWWILRNSFDECATLEMELNNYKGMYEGEKRQREFLTETICELQKKYAAAVREVAEQQLAIDAADALLKKYDPQTVVELREELATSAENFNRLHQQLVDSETICERLRQANNPDMLEQNQILIHQCNDYKDKYEKLKYSYVSDTDALEKQLDTREKQIEEASKLLQEMAKKLADSLIPL